MKNISYHTKSSFLLSCRPEVSKKYSSNQVEKSFNNLCMLVTAETCQTLFNGFWKRKTQNPADPILLRPLAPELEVILIRFIPMEYLISKRLVSWATSW